MEYSDMQPHQQRVVDEKLGLDDKISKLKDFINESPFFDKLGKQEQKRLYRQFTIMDEYSFVLQLRIAAFGTDE